MAVARRMSFSLFMVCFRFVGWGTRCTGVPLRSSHSIRFSPENLLTLNGADQSAFHNLEKHGFGDVEGLTGAFGIIVGHLFLCV